MKLQLFMELTRQFFYYPTKSPDTFIHLSHLLTSFPRLLRNIVHHQIDASLSNFHYNWVARLKNVTHHVIYVQNVKKKTVFKTV